jgi:hypothetical protein
MFATGARRLLAGVGALGVLHLLLEGILRLAPAAIPLHLLQDFSPGLRLSIAARLHLSSEASLQRFVGEDGRELAFYRPNTRVADVTGEGVPEITTDARGFCNAPADSAGPVQAETVVLGDSITWCTSVLPTETFTSVLTRLTGTSSYNLSVIGIGPYEELQLLRRYGLAMSPRRVIMTVYEGNDLRDAINHVASPVHDGQSSPPRGRATFPLLQFDRSFVGRLSYSINTSVAGMMFLRRWLVAQRRSGSPAEAGFPSFQYSVSGLPGETVAFNVANRDLDEPANAANARERQDPFASFDAALADFTRLASLHHFSPIVLYVPSAHTAYSPVQFRDQRLREVLGWFSESQRAYLARKSRELGFVFLDVTPSLQRIAASHRTLPSLLYFPGDLHLTAAGHEAVAHALAQQLHTGTAGH